MTQSFILRYPRGFQNAVAFDVNGDVVTITGAGKRMRVTKQRARMEYRELLNAGYCPA